MTANKRRYCPELRLKQLFETFHVEGFTMSYTIDDFERDYFKKCFPRLTPAEQREALDELPPKTRQEFLQLLPPEERLAGLSAEQIRQYLERLTASAAEPRKPRKPRRKR